MTSRCCLTQVLPPLDVCMISGFRAPQPSHWTR